MLPTTFDTSASIPLNPVESYFWRFEEDLRAFRVAILLRLDGAIQPDLLTVALHQLQRRHPKLRAMIAVDRDARLKYKLVEPAPPIPLEIRDYDGDDSPWREETGRLLSRDFPRNGPLAAVSVLRNPNRRYSELIFTVTHAFADGLSAIMLAGDLLTEYAKAENHVEESSGCEAPASTAQRPKVTKGWRSKLFLYRRFRRLQREQKQLEQLNLPEAANIPPLSQWVHWVFSREETFRLVRRCRKERASLSGALMAAACCGILDCMPAPEAFFKWQLPFNVRDDLDGSLAPATPKDLGCFVSNMNGHFRLPGKPDFWTVARQAQQDIQTFVDEGGPSFSYHVSSFLYGVATGIRRIFGLPPQRLEPSEKDRVTLLATNYGVLSLKDAYGSLRPRGCTLIFKNDSKGPSLIMEALVMGGELNIGFAGDSIQPEFWEKLQNAVRNYLTVIDG